MVFATLGTDHHRFDRLVDWIDDWTDQTGGAVHCVVQHGASRPPRNGTALGIISHEDLLAALDQATVVVTQGGPGSILDARSRGHVPIVVPRLSALDEVVDDHQVTFARRMHTDGEAVVVESWEQFVVALDAALVNPSTLRRPPSPSPAPQTAAAIATIIDKVLARPAGFVRWSRLRRR